MINREEGKALAAACVPYLGTPHRNGAYVKGRGVDCALLPACAAKDLGWFESIEALNIELFYNGEWYLHSNDEKMLRAVERFCDKADDLPIQEGDLLLYKYGRAVSHIVVYVGNNMGIHADAYIGSVCYVDINSQRLAKRYYGRYRLKGGKR